MPKDCTTGGTSLIGLENGPKKENNVFHIMVLKEREKYIMLLYEFLTSSCPTGGIPNYGTRKWS